MTTTDTKLQVGQKLWYVPFGRRYGEDGTGYEVTVEKIGRKWAEVKAEADKPYSWSTERIDIETFAADGHGYDSPGTAYLSREHYEATVSLNKAWRSFYIAVDRLYRVPDGVTVEDIQQAMRILHLESEA